MSISGISLKSASLVLVPVQIRRHMYLFSHDMTVSTPSHEIETFVNWPTVSLFLSFFHKLSHSDGLQCRPELRMNCQNRRTRHLCWKRVAEYGPDSHHTSVETRLAGRRAFLSGWNCFDRFSTYGRMRNHAGHCAMQRAVLSATLGLDDQAYVPDPCGPTVAFVMLRQCAAHQSLDRCRNVCGSTSQIAHRRATESLGALVYWLPTLLDLLGSSVYVLSFASCSHHLFFAALRRSWAKPPLIHTECVRA